MTAFELTLNELAHGNPHRPLYLPKEHQVGAQMIRLIHAWQADIKPHIESIINSTDAATQHSQQDKMKMCNADAAKKELKGDERKAFMKNCLSSKHDPALTSQQNRMKACNDDPKAKTLKGEERKAFMKSCLSGN